MNALFKIFGAGALMFLGAACTSCDKEGGEDSKTDIPMEWVSYTASDEIIVNPERGFYKATSCEMGVSGALNVSTVKGYRDAGYSLIFRYFYLKNFRDKPLTDEALQAFDNDMAVMREAGVKCVLRFAYTSLETEPDAPLSIIETHLDQLKPYIAKNADVIAVWQAGFIGSWGEWYYTTNNLNNPTARAAVLDKLLEVLPENRVVQVRTPQYKQEYLKRTEALKPAEAYTQMKAARIGHHNDCFMASETDYGTYQNVTEDKKYLSQEGLYLPMGGETCPPSGISPADCTKAQEEMRNLRWSYLNSDYYKGVNDRWIAQGCMDNIKREMGYRFVLTSGEYTTNVTPGHLIKVVLRLKNVGYTAPFNPRAIELVMRNVSDSTSYVLPLDVDPRKWKPKAENTIEVEAGLPADMPVGDYDIYLNMPDPMESLRDRPEYSIQLANKDVWEAETGYNSLFMRVNVTTDEMTDTYKGDRVFTKK